MLRDVKDNTVIDNYELVRHSLGGGEPQILRPFSSQKFIVDVRNNYFFFQEYLDGQDGSFQHSVLSCAQLTPEGLGEETELLRWDQEDGILFIRDGIAYQYEKATDSLTIIDLLTEETDQFPVSGSLSDFWSDDAELYVRGMWGPCLFLQGNRNREHFFFLLDITTGQVTENKMLYQNFMEETLLQEVISSFDDKFLIHTGGEPILLEFQNLQSPFSYWAEDRAYAIIRQQDYFDMKPEKSTPVKEV